MSTTSFYCSDRNFRRFELLIAEAVRAYPSVIVKRPEDYSLTLTTFVARLRDAISAYDRFGFSSNQIDQGLFKSARASGLTVSAPSTAPGLVLIGSRNGIHNHIHPVDPLPATPVEVVDLTSFSFTPDALVTICHMAALRCLHPVKLKLLPSQVEHYCNLFDIDLAPVDDQPDTYILT